LFADERSTRPRPAGREVFEAGDLSKSRNFEIS